ncbi:MAG: hypothetical protein KVP17_003044 [Porospora cf. gigantea B]|uniref:uncharacterized protein n=1 Tax=Porospora cf. gigantea B TaxID=2853592 RepID=UPI003571EB22|nr:MAG: hypothetical protein KVP17_003044 [Porospora cf. gigantea B]
MSYGAHSQHSHVRQVSTPGVNQKYQPAHSTRAETWSNQTQMPYDSATVTTYECAPTYVMDGHNFHDYWARACKADRDYI